MNDKDRIVEEVRKALNGLFDEPDRDWTRGVKTALCKACKTCNEEFSLYATELDRECPRISTSHRSLGCHWPLCMNLQYCNYHLVP